jgi:uncharacterized Zn-finger protein
MPIIVTCKYCNKEFKSAIRRGITAKYCSKECYSKAWTGKHPELYKNSDVKCPQCGEIFHPTNTNTRFCSRGCAASWNKNIEQRGQGNTRIAKCLVCGKEYKRNSKHQKYCSFLCAKSQRCGENNNRFNGYTNTNDRYLRYTANHPEYPNQYVHDVVYKNTHDNDKCETCGNQLELVHHKDRDKHNNEPNNLQGLCKTCHVKLHATEDKHWFGRK